MTPQGAGSKGILALADGLTESSDVDLARLGLRGVWLEVDSPVKRCERRRLSETAPDMS